MLIATLKNVLRTRIKRKNLETTFTMKLQKRSVMPIRKTSEITYFILIFIKNNSFRKNRMPLHIAFGATSYDDAFFKHDLSKEEIIT